MLYHELSTNITADHVLDAVESIYYGLIDMHTIGLLYVICFLAGGLGAILQGMLGIGTGIVIIPVLTFSLPYYDIPHDQAIHVAIATSMAAIAVNSITALMSHHRHNNIDWVLFRKIIGFSTIGAGVGALGATFLAGYLLQKVFSLFLFFVAGYMFIKKPRYGSDEQKITCSRSKMMIGGFGVGCIASLVGSGGSILMVPFLHAMHYKMRFAVGTATLIGLPVALIGALIYMILGTTQLPSTSVTIGYLHWPALLAITSAGLVCAPLGVRLSASVPTRMLLRGFAALVMGIGLKMFAYP